MCTKAAVIVSILTAGMALAGTVAVMHSGVDMDGAASTVGMTGATDRMSAALAIIATTTATGWATPAPAIETMIVTEWA